MDYIRFCHPLGLLFATLLPCQSSVHPISIVLIRFTVCGFQPLYYARYEVECIKFYGKTSTWHLSPSVCVFSYIVIVSSQLKSLSSRFFPLPFHPLFIFTTSPLPLSLSVVALSILFSITVYIAIPSIICIAYFPNTHTTHKHTRIPDPG